MLQYPHPISVSRTDPLVSKIVFLAKVLESVPIHSEIAAQIFHTQIFKSSFFSAKIEGNSLSITQALGDENSREKREIDNCEKALRTVKTFPSTIAQEHILKLHSIILDGLRDDRGMFRTEQSGVFDPNGNVIYLTPDRNTLAEMLASWLHEAEKNPSVGEYLVNAARSHYYFEKIHPFLDGNGRTGRVLLQWYIRRSGLFGEHILPIDEYLNMHRSTYYAYLEQNTRHVEDFTQFLLEGIIWSLEHILSQFKEYGGSEKPAGKPALLPRREELIAIITDHPLCTFDFLSRRFPTTPVRTLAYDLAWLVKNNYIRKHGQTRGVRYSARIL